MASLPLPEPPGFSNLTKADQIRYLQELWDRIADQPGELPVPESHLDLAEQRLEAYRKEPHLARPAHDLLERLTKTSS
ncbi:MAG: addiction module protein [Deltaproteobacteria bacterium]|nr:addiction module protein [Deltaproteobacteria bacterium]